MKYIIYSGMAFLAIVLFFNFERKSEIQKGVQELAPVERTIEAVAALGQLSPSGEKRMLAAPISGLGGTPRVEYLFVDVGDQVEKGQVLASFDNKDRILADLDISKVRLLTLRKKISAQRREISRYLESVSQGGSPQVLLDEKNDELTELYGKEKELIAEIKALKVDLSDSELRSPINGIVLKILSREGERPGVEGVLEVGASQKMEALIEVYESDVNRVSLGQSVTLTSENGGFKGTLLGEVIKISPQVSQRRVLTTDPTGDADARVVEVRIKLDSSSSSKVKSYTGMKVIARFDP